MAGAFGTLLFLPCWSETPRPDTIDDIFREKIPICIDSGYKKEIWRFFQRLAKFSVVVGAVSAFAGVVVEIMFISSSSGHSAGIGKGFFLSVFAMVILLIFLFICLLELCCDACYSNKISNQKAHSE
jgi:FlaA1/EpsC-like NDP-sugar epimerase